MKTLIIEDDKEILQFLKSGLESEFFVVDGAKDGEQGSFMARTNPYDVIILDFMLPKLNGLEVCQEIRQDNITAPIIMLTVKNDLDTKTCMFKAGVDDYVTKPFIFEELLMRLKAINKRPQIIQSEILQIDDLQLNTNSQEVFRGNKKIYLTRKEYCLLKYFLKNIDRVLSRGLILENVWDINADPFSNTIESHILNLRKKIKKPGSRKIIHTLPGRGYKMSLNL